MDGELRCYVDGVEIDRLEPKLPFLGEDDWFWRFVDWANRKYPTLVMWAIFDMNPHDGNESKASMQELWVGEIPAWKRRMVSEERIVQFSRAGFGEG